MSEKVHLILIEKGGEILLPYLDKFDLAKLSRGKIIFNSFIFLVSIVW